MGLGLLAATVTIIYPLLAGQSYEACKQKVGDASPTCVNSTVDRLDIPADDGATYDFWVVFNGQESIKRRVEIPAKKPVEPTLIVKP